MLLCNSKICFTCFFKQHWNFSQDDITFDKNPIQIQILRVKISCPNQFSFNLKTRLLFQMKYAMILLNRQFQNKER